MTFARSILSAIVTLLLALLLPAQAMAQTTDARDFAGAWRSDFDVRHFIGFDLEIVPTGDPVRILRATGFAGRTPVTTTECNRLAAQGAERGRWALGMCEGVEKGDLKPVEIELQVIDGSYRGVDAFSGATFTFSRLSGNPATPINVDVTMARSDGTSENYGLGYLQPWPDRAPARNHAGRWIGEVAGLAIEMDLKPAGNTVAAEFRYFPDGDGPAPGAVTAGLGEVAAKERSFAMVSVLRHAPARGRNSALTAAVAHLPEEWQIGHSHFASMRLLTSATLEVRLAKTREDLLGNRGERLLFRPLDRDLRAVAPVPGAFEAMSGLWTGRSGPLTLELDIEVPSDGALKGEIRHFDDGAGAFPAGVSGGFTWAHEVASKERPFAAYMAGSGGTRPPAITGTVETGPQGNINWTTSYRLRKKDDETLLLDYSVPNQPVAFGGPPIELKRLTGPLRDVATPVEAPSAGVAGLWTFRTDERGGGVYLLRLDEAKANLDGRFIAQFVPQATGGECERFARTQGICELARDKGPVNTAIRLEPTGDARWTHMGAHGVRAFGGDTPAYTDLRIRVAPGPSPDELLVQMTANDAFGLGPEGTYIFARVEDASRLNLSTGIDQEGKAYVAAQADAIGGGACESWAKEDSLLRQRNDAALTAQLDAILGAQALSVSGHPMDRQCKAMLDAIAALDAGNATPSPAPQPDPSGGEAPADGQVWRGAYYAYLVSENGGSTLKRIDQLDGLTLRADAFEVRVVADADRLVLTGESEVYTGAGRTFELAAGAFGDLFGERFTAGASSREPDLAAALRLPADSGVTPIAFVGADALAYTAGNYRTLGLSRDGRRMAVHDDSADGFTRFLLLEKVEDAPSPQPVENADGGLAGQWTRMGQAYYSFPAGEVWRGDNPVNATTDRFEVTGNSSAYRLSIGGSDIGPLEKADLNLAALGRHLDKATPETGNIAINQWLGADAEVYWSFGGGGDLLLLGPDADAADRRILIAFGRSRAVVITGALHGLTDLELGIGTVPQTLNVIPFERNRKPDQSVANNGADPAPAPGPDGQSADAGRSPVCLALEARTAELNAAADTATVQIIRSVYSDVGLAFGGEETEARCQRALDQLAGLALIGPDATADDAGTANNVDIDNSTSIVNTVVGNLTTYVNNGGSWSAPDAPDACGALAPISGGLSLSGGIELSGLLGDLFLSIGFDSAGRATPEQCYNALTVLDDLGLDPADADNMATVIEIVNTIAPPRTAPDGRPLVTPGREQSRACEAYFAFTGAVLERADTPLVQFLRGYAIENGYGMGSTAEPTASDCARMLRELVELGLDPSLPDGGWSRAEPVVFAPAPAPAPLPEPQPRPAPVQAGPAGGYDPRPEAEPEPVGLRPTFDYIFAEPALDPAAIRSVEGLPAIIAFFVPADGLLGQVSAPEGNPDFCNEGRLLPQTEAFRTWASMRELYRHFPAPTAILSGRDCVLAEMANEIAAATYGDPSFENADELVGAGFDRRLDGHDLTDEGKALVPDAVGALLAGLPEEDHHWFVAVTTPDIVEALTGSRPAPGSVTLYDRWQKRAVTGMRMRIPDDAR